VVEVKNGKAKLPDNYRSLYAAYLCEPLGYSNDPEVEENMLQSSHYYVERTTYGTDWSECNGCCTDKSENIIRENLYFKKNRLAEFYYQSPVLLTLSKSFNKNNCHSKCRNLYFRDNENEINIIENTLQANFNSGYVYVMYYGLPTDADGNITFPNDKNGEVEEYIEYAIKLNTTERLMGDDDAGKLEKMYPIYDRRHSVARKRASNVVKMKKLTPRTFTRIEKLNQQESFMYESSLTDKSGTLYTDGVQSISTLNRRSPRH